MVFTSGHLAVWGCTAHTGAQHRRGISLSQTESFCPSDAHLSPCPWHPMKISRDFHPQALFQHPLQASPGSPELRGWKKSQPGHKRCQPCPQVCSKRGHGPQHLSSIATLTTPTPSHSDSNKLSELHAITHRFGSSKWEVALGSFPCNQQSLGHQQI